jgi:hypothetical protein
MEVSFHLFLTSTLNGGVWSASRHRSRHPRKRRPIPVELEAGWADSFGEEKISRPAGVRNLESPAHGLVATPTTVHAQMQLKQGTLLSGCLHLLLSDNTGCTRSYFRTGNMWYKKCVLGVSDKGQSTRTKQTMLRTYNVTLRRVPATFVPLEQRQVLHILLEIPTRWHYF